MHMSLCCYECVLTLLCICPYAVMNVSSPCCAYVLYTDVTPDGTAIPDAKVATATGH